jgi:two-component system, chemotaxis family, chemotaxis protein CheY
MPDASHRRPILIIDDSLAIRQQVRQTLEEAGYDVLEACDGQVGLETIDSNPALAMVICDLNMPRMGGLQFLETYQSSQRPAHLPVVILTTDRSPEEIGKAKRLGARGWIVKPFHPDRLVATVQWIAGAPGR